MHTAESNFSNFVIKYPGKIETEFENILACLSGAQIKKTGGRKSRDTLPLISCEIYQVFVFNRMGLSPPPPHGFTSRPGDSTTRGGGGLARAYLPVLIGEGSVGPARGGRGGQVCRELAYFQPDRLSRVLYIYIFIS